MQALTQMVVEVADRGRGVVDLKQIGKPDIVFGTREQGVEGVAVVIVHVCDMVLGVVLMMVRTCWIGERVHVFRDSQCRDHSQVHDQWMDGFDQDQYPVANCFGVILS